jgi:tetratricopeptide (TPR) repeat protein
MDKDKHLEGAMAQFKKVVALDPDLKLDPETEAKKLAASRLVDIGGGLAKAGRIDEAIDAFTNALEFSPNNAVAYYNRGNVYRNAGKPKQAIADYSKAIELVPNLAVAHNGLCWWGSLLGRVTDVIDACERAVELAPDNGGHRDSRSLARALTGDYDGAIKDFKFFIEWSEKNAWFNRTQCRCARGLDNRTGRLKGAKAPLSEAEESKG